MIKFLRRTLGPIKFKLLNTRVSFSPHPHGINPFHDILRLVPGYTVDVFLDVGANVGDVTASVHRRFPRSRIYAFEPVSESYSILKSRFVGVSGIEVFNHGLGSSEGMFRIYTDGSSSINSMKAAAFENRSGQASEEIRIRTLDEVTAEFQISRISYLKIDTEGFDLEVLNGGRKLLERGVIDFIEVEAGMYPENDVHVYYPAFIELLEPYGYKLFGIYEQVHEWKHHLPILRRSNLLFISGPVVKDSQAL